MSVTLFTWINERYRKATLPKTYDIIFDSKCIYIINERYVLDVFDRLHPNKSFKTVLIPVIFFFRKYQKTTACAVYWSVRTHRPFLFIFKLQQLIY